MSMKTILVPTENHDAMQSALESALLLAGRFDSYIEGFALRWQINEFIGGDMMGGFSPKDYTQDIAEEAKKARQIFESFMQKHDVSRVFDVIVMNRPDANSTGLYHGAIESGLFESGRPILLSPPSPPLQIATNVLIAWNCSTEQARAIALAMPLLQKADRVTVLTVIGGTGVPGPTDEQLIRYLQRNGIVAEPLRVELDGRSTGEAILATAQSLGCDLLIKGAYTQSRLRQMIFGGATQHVLANTTLPVLLAN